MELKFSYIFLQLSQKLYITSLSSPQIQIYNMYLYSYHSANKLSSKSCKWVADDRNIEYTVREHKELPVLYVNI